MPARRIDLNLFRVLDAIHVHGGISAAARALHLTQPAVTHSLNRLRGHFDDPLFVRQGNRVVPTECTLSVIGEVQQHLRGLQASVQRELPFAPGALDTTFTVGFRDGLESIALPPLAQRLSERAPGVRLVSRSTSSGELERELLAGTLDLAVDRRRRTGPRIAGDAVVDESLAVAMRRDHPLATYPLRRPDYLGARHVAVVPPGEPAALDVLLHQGGRDRDVRLTCQHYFAAGEVAATSDLLLTLPAGHAAHLASLLPLAVRPLPLKLRPVPILAYWVAARSGERGHAWLRGEVIAAVRHASMPPARS